MSRIVRLNPDIAADKFTVEHWLVQDGEAVAEGQQLLTVRVDGELHTVTAPLEGIFLSTGFLNGQELPGEEILGEIISSEEAGDIRISESLTRKERRILEALHSDKGRENQRRRRVHIKATPSARRFARQNAVDLEKVNGSGPDGRIQLKDVTDYINQMSEKNKDLKTNSKPQTIAYGLPLTPLARRLARKSNLDISKIPAPPGAVKIRKKDVERFLRNPDSADAIIMREYNLQPAEESVEAEQIQVTEPEGKEVKEAVTIALPGQEVHETLPEPAQGVIRLTTEIPSEAITGDIIELDQKTRLDIPALEGPGQVPALEEPVIGPGKVIRLTTDVPLSALSEGQIELEQIRQIDIPMLISAGEPVLLTEPEQQSSVIRLTTDEASEVASQSVIELVSEEKERPAFNKMEEPLSLNAPDDNILPGQTEPIVLRLPSEEVSEASGIQAILLPEEGSTGPIAVSQTFRIVHYSAPVYINLDGLGAESEDIVEIAADKSLIRKILQAVSSAYQQSGIIEDETGGTFYIENIEEPDKQIFVADSEESSHIIREGRPVFEAGQEDLTVVNLLEYSITGVSELLDTLNRKVLYFTRSQYEAYVEEQETILPINLVLEFDSDIMDPLQGLKLIETVKKELESLEDKADEQ